MIVNSKFSSLYLGYKEYWKVYFDQDVCYMQKFAVNEEIRIQFVGFTEGFEAKYIDCKGQEFNVDVTLLYTHEGHDGKRLYELVFSVAETGIYQFILTNGVDEASVPFKILDKEDLQDTVLISYAHRRDEYDALFFNQDGTQKVFNFRIEGGFYPGDKLQSIENEIFRDQRFSPYQISAESYEVLTLTVGTKRGVPQWVGNKINNIFKLSDVYVDHISTTRNESSVPELISQSSNYPLYVFKFKVEQSDEDRIFSKDGSRIFDPSFNPTFN